MIEKMPGLGPLPGPSRIELQKKKVKSLKTLSRMQNRTPLAPTPAGRLPHGAGRGPADLFFRWKKTF
jgi:hypothetical protein